MYNATPRVTEEITEAIDRGDDADLKYLDFCKAFDKVPHRRLLIKLRGYGIKGKMLQWMQKFVSNREQRAQPNHC